MSQACPFQKMGISTDQCEMLSGLQPFFEIKTLNENHYKMRVINGNKIRNQDSSR